MTADDRTTKARIRDAAIDCYRELGIQGTTARKVAERADVSPALVMHHYGSMDALREACDAHVVAIVRDEKRAAIAQGEKLDPFAAVRDSEGSMIAGYLAAVLTEDSPIVAKLVDELVADAKAYLKEGEQAGSFRPSDQADERAALLMLWSLGSLVLHRHAKRLFGVDLTDLEASDDAALTPYLAATYELVGEGIFTDSFAKSMREAVTKDVR